MSIYDYLYTKIRKNMADTELNQHGGNLIDKAACIFKHTQYVIKV